MNNQLLINKIEAALSEVAEAEKALGDAIAGAEKAPRASKSTVTDVVRLALAKLRAARGDLDELRRLVPEEE
jgi:hypothetical protein